MFTVATIQTDFFGGATRLVGFRDDLLTAFQILEAPLKTSSSGLYVNDYHSLITTQNMKSIAPEGLSDAQFNDWLENICKGATAKVLAAIYEGERSFHETLRLYNYANVYDETITLSGNGFVGFEITPFYKQGLRLAIDNLGTWFNGAETATLYLFHSGVQAAIDSQAISTTANQETWQALNFDLDYIASAYSGGKFYIGYRKQDLTYAPINRKWDKANIRSMANYFDIRPISVPDYTGTTLFDIDTIQAEADTFGLNFEFTVKTDLTRSIIQQKNLYARVIALQIARDLLERMANSQRTNEIKKETRDLALFDLKGDGNIKGMENTLAEAIKDIRKNLQGNVIPQRRQLRTYTVK